MSVSADLPDEDLRALVQDAQWDGRVPGLAAAIGRAGLVVWHDGVGFSDVSTASGAGDGDLQYRIGSITKTFTAATVLLLVEDGLVELDAPFGHYVPGTPFDTSTIRQLLAHTGGVQREAPGDMWVTGQGPTSADLRRDLAAAERVAAPGDRWHYSNLGYALLGLVVCEVVGTSCQQVVDQRLLGPLGLSRTTWAAVSPAATGYERRPHEDSVEVARDMEQRAVGVGGQMWSTVADLVVWADVLSGGRPDVVPRRVIDRMHTVQVITDAEWTVGWGLGLVIRRHGGETFAGHTGAIDGFLAALMTHRQSRRAAVVVANATRGVDTGDLAVRMLARTNAVARRDTATWEPNDRCPEDLAAVLGGWWSEGAETVFEWREGRLQAYLTADPRARSVFVQVGDDEFRVESGRLFGERLSVDRAERAGSHPIALVWATYRYVRAGGVGTS